MIYKEGDFYNQDYIDEQIEEWGAIEEYDDGLYVCPYCGYVMGDILVTLIISTKQLGINPTECLELAYNKIKDRQGKNYKWNFCQGGRLIDGKRKCRSPFTLSGK